MFVYAWGVMRNLVIVMRNISALRRQAQILIGKSYHRRSSYVWANTREEVRFLKESYPDVKKSAGNCHESNRTKANGKTCIREETAG